MSERKDDGGPVFPQQPFVSGGCLEWPSAYGWEGISLRDYFAAHAPEPTDAQIKFVSTAEAAANPHGYEDKPTRHSHREIVAMLRYQWADDMIAARKEQK